VSGDLLKQIERLDKEAGETVETRKGGSHTVVKFGDKQTVVPRHAEINEITAKKILKQLGD
jgi:mRNA interferase HicA